MRNIKKIVYTISLLVLVQNGFTQDKIIKDASLAQLKVLANDGSAEAMREIAKKYYFGQEIPHNYAMAYEWFSKAAKLNDAEAMVFLGDMISVGIGEDQDWDKVISLWQESANLGNTAAMNLLGTVYINGRISVLPNKNGVPKNEEKAIYWFTQSAMKGDANGMGWLGIMYSSFDKPYYDDKKAYDWLIKAQKAGNKAAMYNTGVFYFGLSKGFAKNANHVAKWMIRNIQSQGAYMDFSKQHLKDLIQNNEITDETLLVQAKKLIE